jgi:nitrogen fixation/metabolism regulation signal transduction histidine kinase
VLYALSVADLTMLVALVFVLARNIIKLVVERRRALPFARFRAKLVAVLLGLTLVPSILVLLVGSELIRNSADRWFNAPMDEILSSANRIASDYYAERQRSVVAQSARIARQVSDGEPGVGRHRIAAGTDRERRVLGPGEAGGGVPRGVRHAAIGRAGARAGRGVAVAASGCLARLGRTPGQPRRRRGDGNLGARADRRRRRAAARRVARQGAERADRGCRRWPATT